MKIYKNKNILITGNTGFVGANLSLVLLKIGANVIGYSDEVFEHFNKLNLIFSIPQHYGDVKDFNKLKKVIAYHNIDMIIHLASQPIVKLSYEYPKETYETNILGTLNILEILRRELKDIPAFLNITSDKCYKNIEQSEGYIESNELNGYDPYSNSKSISELITNTYRNSFFNPDDYTKTHETLVATARAGNILGMGDFGKYRLLPDIMTSYYNKEIVKIRQPKSVRPWTFVLDTISGYLLLGEKLLEGNKAFADAWNFSSNVKDMITVEELLKKIQKYCNVKYVVEQIEDENMKETGILRLDSTKAEKQLKWKPKYNINRTIDKTVSWYMEYYDNGKIITEQQINEYLKEKK